MRGACADAVPVKDEVVDERRLFALRDRLVLRAAVSLDEFSDLGEFLRPGRRIPGNVLGRKDCLGGFLEDYRHAALLRSDQAHGIVGAESDDAQVAEDLMILHEHERRHRRKPIIVAGAAAE